MVRRSTRLAEEAKKSIAQKQTPTKDAAFKKMEADLKKCEAQLSAEKTKGLKNREKDRKTIVNLLREARENRQEEDRLQNAVEKYEKELKKGRETLKTAEKYCQDSIEIAKNAANRALKAQEMSSHFLQRSKDMTNEKQGPLPWQTCEICVKPYGQTEARIPRLLPCGHTLCTECCQNAANERRKTWNCPFCHIGFWIGGSVAEEYRKNFAVLEMCT